MSSVRIITGLRSAATCLRPDSIPKARARGRKAAGLRYERELAKALPEGNHGQWFQFVDAKGPGLCQPDLLLEFGGGIAILEAKYTWTPVGHLQVERLYRPVVGLAMGRATFGLVVCKVLTREVNRSWVCGNLQAALLRASSGLPTVLHWIGGTLAPFGAAASRSHLAQAMASL